MRIQATRLEDFTRTIFARAGCAEQEASRLGRYLVGANLVGHDSHGVIRVKPYIDFVKRGLVVPNRAPRIVFETPGLLVVDGEYGFGQSIAELAFALAFERARSLPLLALALRNTGHVGRVGDWPTLAARAGLVSLHFVNTTGLGILVAPFGGIDRRLSANPIAAGVPVPNGEPIVLDISTCAIAEGKVRVALNKGERVPPGSIVDSEGRPTDDPRVFYADPPGALLPFGGDNGAHKGYGLGVITEILAGALTGSGTSKPGQQRLLNGMFSLFLNPDRFPTDTGFAAEVARFIAFVKSSRTIAPGGEILMPGEIERRTHERRSKEGIDLDPNTIAQLTGVAREVGVPEEQIPFDLAPEGRE